MDEKDEKALIWLFGILVIGGGLTMLSTPIIWLIFSIKSPKEVKISTEENQIVYETNTSKETDISYNDLENIYYPSSEDKPKVKTIEMYTK